MEEERLKNYCPNPGFQEEFFRSKASVRAIFSGNQGGKALANNELVLTPYSWKKIKDIKNGDQVFGEDGNICNVVGVYPQGLQDIYTVKFDDESSVECTLDHLWAILPRKWQRSKRKIMTTDQIIKRGFKNKQRVIIPVTKPVQFPAVPVLIDPYTLGAILGDGTMTQDLRFSTADPEILTYLKLPGCYLKKLSNYDYGIRSHTKNNPMIDALRTYKLFGEKSYTKFIPKDYLFNTPSVRLAILQGLMDTDGTVSKHSGRMTFSSASIELAKNVKFIVQSLGGKSKIREKISNINTKSYRVSIRLPRTKVFKLKRKQKLVFDPVSTCDERVIVSIEKTGKSHATCIRVDSQHNTFLTRDFVVTHNTHGGSVEAALYALGEHPYKKIRTPNIGWIVTAKKLEEGIENDILPKLRSVVGSKDIVDIKNDKQGKPYKIIWRSDSITYFKSAEQKDMTFEGTTLDWAWFDEPSRRALYVAVSRGLMKSNGHLWYTCTLIDEPWLYEDIYLKGLDPKEKDFEIFIGSTDENIHLSNDGKEKFFNKLTEDEIQTRRYGKPSDLTGRVFKEFDSQRHKIKPFNIPYHWPVYVSIDPHRNKPHAVLFVAVSPNNVKYVCNEIFIKCTIYELAEHIKELEEQYNIVERFIDTSAQEEGWGRLSARQMLESKGVATKLAQKKNLKKSGILAINQWFKNDECFIFEYCDRIIREMNLYVYKKDKDGTPTDEPNKKFDDMCDNLRYIAVEKPEFLYQAPIHDPGPIDF